MTTFVLYKNGNIHTMDEAKPVAEAMITAGGKFAFVGGEAESREFIKEKGTFGAEVDLGRRLVIPGLNDSHLHFLHFVNSAKNVGLTGAGSIAELKSRMKEALAKRTPGDKNWLRGEGWNHDYFEDEKRFPDRRDLDEISTEIPIIVMRSCFHVGAVNSPALEALGLNGKTARSYGALVGLSADGEPDGVLKEGMLDNLKTQVTPQSSQSLKERLAEGQESALAQGLTSLQSDDLGYMTDSDYGTLFRVFREMEAEGTLRVRISEQCLLEDKRILDKFFAEGYHVGSGCEKFRVGCVKLIADGSLGARTAALRQPYADDPAAVGLALFSQEELDELVMTAHRNGCPTAVHCIGDRALDMALDAIERAQRTLPSRLRHGIVHCQITHESQLRRMAELNVQALVQPIFIDYDMSIVESRVGRELAKTSYSWRSMDDLGISVSFGSDCPVEPFATMPNIYTAVTRKNITGDRGTYLPGQKMTMERAIRAYTAGSAYAAGEEDIKGTISAGKLADFIILDRDLFSLRDPEEILEAKVLETYVGGKREYLRK